MRNASTLTEEGSPFLGIIGVIVVITGCICFGKEVRLWTFDVPF
jgi:hypothetical protein